MRRMLVFTVTLALSLVTMASTATAAGTIMQFTTMVGVDGSFVGHNPIRGVMGDELPWEIGHRRLPGDHLGGLRHRYLCQPAQAVCRSDRLHPQWLGGLVVRRDGLRG